MKVVPLPFTPVGSNQGLNSYFQHSRSECQKLESKQQPPLPPVLLMRGGGVSCMRFNSDGTETCSFCRDVFDK